jgi:hypothetical protein
MADQLKPAHCARAAPGRRVAPCVITKDSADGCRLAMVLTRFRWHRWPTPEPSLSVPELVR